MDHCPPDSFVHGNSPVICPLEGHTVAMGRLLDSWVPSASTKTLEKVKFSPNFSHLIFEKGVKKIFVFLTNFCWSIVDRGTRTLIPSVYR